MFDFLPVLVLFLYRSCASFPHVSDWRCHAICLHSSIEGGWAGSLLVRKLSWQPEGCQFESWVWWPIFFVGKSQLTHKVILIRVSTSPTPVLPVRTLWITSSVFTAGFTEPDTQYIHLLVRLLSDQVGCKCVVARQIEGYWLPYWSHCKFKWRFDLYLWAVAGG